MKRNMNSNIKKLAVAIALAAAAGGANASMVNSQGNGGQGSELFLYAWSDQAATSYVRDLGILLTDFLPKQGTPGSNISFGATAPTQGSKAFSPTSAVTIGAGNVNSSNYSLAFQPDALMLSAIGNGTSLNADVMWGIAAADAVGNISQQRALTTCVTTDCLTAIRSERNSTIPSYGSQHEFVTGDHNLRGTHVSPNLNGSSQAPNDGQQGDVSVSFGLNWGGYVNAYEAATGVGNSMEFFYIQPSSTNTVGFMNGVQYENAGGASRWTLGTDGGVSYQAAVVPIPAAMWLFGSGLLGLVGIARRKKTA